MTVEKNERISVPLWLASVIAPLIVAVCTTLMVNAATTAELKLQAKTNKENIDTLRSEKADKETFEIIQEQLIRIERKLDQHILNK